MTTRLLGVDFLWVVHGNHVSVLHRYGDMASQISVDIERKIEEGKKKEEGKEERKEKGKEKMKGTGKRKGNGKRKEKENRGREG